MKIFLITWHYFHRVVSNEQKNPWWKHFCFVLFCIGAHHWKKRIRNKFFVLIKNICKGIKKEGLKIRTKEKSHGVRSLFGLLPRKGCSAFIFSIMSLVLMIITPFLGKKFGRLGFGRLGFPQDLHFLLGQPLSGRFSPWTIWGKETLLWLSGIACVSVVGK